MSEKIKQGAIARGTMVIAALVIIIAGMREASDILVPFLVAVFIAVIGATAVFWLKNKGGSFLLGSAPGCPGDAGGLVLA